MRPLAALKALFRPRPHDLARAARALEVDEETVLGWIEYRGLPAEYVDGSWRIDRDLLQRWRRSDAVGEINDLTRRANEAASRTIPPDPNE